MSDKDDKKPDDDVKLDADGKPIVAAAPEGEDDFGAEFDRLTGVVKAGDVEPNPKLDKDGKPVVVPTAATDDDDDKGGDDKTQPDPWEGLTDAQRKRLDDINGRLSTSEELAKRHMAANAGLNRKTQELMKQLEGKGTDAKPTPTAEELTAALADPESWKKLEEDFPSIAGPMKKILESHTKQVVDRLTSTIEAKTKPLLARYEADDELREKRFMEEQVETLTKAHPDWQTVKATNEFKVWMNSQPEYIKEASESSTHASDAIDILDRYKSAATARDADDLQQRRQGRLKQAALPPASNGRAATAGRPNPIPDDFDAAWDAYDRQAQK